MGLEEGEEKGERWCCRLAVAARVGCNLKTTAGETCGGVPQDECSVQRQPELNGTVVGAPGSSFSTNATTASREAV